MSTSKQLGARARHGGRESQAAKVDVIIKRTMEGQKDRKRQVEKLKREEKEEEADCCLATSSHHHREIPPTPLLNATSVLDVSSAADTKASISEREQLCETSVPCVRTSSAYMLGEEATA